MSEPIFKATALELIEEALADAEAAIQAHPPETAQAYAEGAQAHRQGMEWATETEWSRKVGLSLSELSTIHRYLFAVSFMSAWWHLQRDKPRRDRAAQAACLLVSGTGIGLDEAMLHLVRYEQAWRSAMVSKGLVGSRNAGCAAALVACVSVLGGLERLPDAARAANKAMQAAGGFAAAADRHGARHIEE